MPRVDPATRPSEPTGWIRRFLARPTRGFLLAVAAYVAAGGYVHLREWLNTYRDVPGSVPGAEVVTVGFPVNVAASAVLAGALIAAGLGWIRRRGLVNALLAATAAFQLGSLAVLVGTRYGTVLGWSERVWTRGAEQSLALELGALAVLVVLVGLRTAADRRDAGGAGAHGAAAAA